MFVLICLRSRTPAYSDAPDTIIIMRIAMGG